MQQFFRLTPEGREPIAGDNLERRLNAGEVILIPNGMSMVGGLAGTRDIIFDEIRRVVGAERADAVRSDGLLHVHKHLSVQEIDAAHTGITVALRRHWPPLTEELIRKLLGISRFWINNAVVLRFYLPNTIMRRHYALLKKKNGKLVQHGPHHDYWQNVALNALNVWIAVDRVDAGNGMIVCTERWGEALPRGHESVRDDQQLGIPTVIACAPGDVVLFHSQHLHGGILNRTDETRVVVTTRVVTSWPRHPRLGNSLFYSPASAIRAGRDRLATLSAHLEQVRLPNLARNVERVFARFRGGGSPGREKNRLRLFDRYLRSHYFPVIADRALPATVEDHPIRPLDRERIAVILDGKTYELSRRCPHQGGDLACGYLKDGHIYCPLHNQPFDVTTGDAIGPGAGLPPLKVRCLSQ